MVDLILGVVFVVLAARGWWRGLVREALGLAVLVLGLVLSFRLSTPVGKIVEAMAGVAQETGRLIAGVIIFFGISIGATVISHVLHKGLRVVPGLPIANRVAGAGFSVIAALAVATVAISLLAVSSPPTFVSEQLKASSLARYLTAPDDLPQKVLGVVSGDRVIERLLNLRDLGGSKRLVYDGDAIAFEPVSSEKLDIDGGSRDEMLELLNRERASSRVDPLVEHEPLHMLAEAHALDVYANGKFDENDSDGRSLDDRLADAGILVVVADQVMALAVSPKAAQEALLSRPVPLVVLTDPAFRRVGIAVVDGPMGVILVEILSG